MKYNFRRDVDDIICKLVNDINPYENTVKCLDNIVFDDGKKILIAIGKAAHTMASAVADNIEIDEGVVITKYSHNKGNIKNTKIFEAGHPISDENSILATDYVLNITYNLSNKDNIILCISGGGSALFEKPLVSLNTIQDINNQLIKSSADINEINIIRKRLSSVKAGRFANHCKPAHIYAIVLSDVIGNDLSAIASGPVSIDYSTAKKANDIINKYSIVINNEVKELLNVDTPKDIDNVDTHFVGSNDILCDKTKVICEQLGYKSIIVRNNCKDNVVDIASEFETILKTNKETNCAYIIGGESVVNVKGNGLGGRNQELALLCSRFIKDYDNACIFTFGSDGTDGPTDAAGGYVDSSTYDKTNIEEYLNNNDSYHALKNTDGLIVTGPTGSNINDVYVLLVR